MNQRSTSAIRKLKTDLNEENTFEKKVAKAIKDKKQCISKMITPRLPGYRFNHYSINADKYNQIPSQPLRSKNINVSQQFIKQFEEKKFNEYCCSAHPCKKGIFQESQNINNYHCHECAINLVRRNIKVHKITSQSLIIKALFQEQLQKIIEQESKIKHLIQDYYENLRSSFHQLYLQSYDLISKGSVISFGCFQSRPQMLPKTIDCLGKIQTCAIKFPDYEKKENFNSKNVKGRQSHDNRSIDIKLETNRSLQDISEQRNSSFIGRSRQNSFYKKKKVQIVRTDNYQSKKDNKYQSRKGIYLR